MDRRHAAEAQRLLDEPVLKALLHEMERGTLDEILTCQPDEDAKRLALVERLRVIRDVPSALRTAAAATNVRSAPKLP